MGSCRTGQGMVMTEAALLKDLAGSEAVFFFGAAGREFESRLPDYSLFSVFGFGAGVDDDRSHIPPA